MSQLLTRSGQMTPQSCLLKRNTSHKSEQLLFKPCKIIHKKTTLLDFIKHLLYMHTSTAKKQISFLSKNILR